MKIIMTNDNVLVAEVAAQKKEEKTASGIILTGVQPTVATSPQGMIIAVGPQVVDLKAGDLVYCDWTKGIAVDVEDKQAKILEESAIKAVVSK